MAGSGLLYAWMIGRRFEMAARRLRFREAPLPLRTDLFIFDTLDAAIAAAPRGGA